MSQEILIENEEETESPMSAEEFTGYFLQDVVINNDPDELAGEFIREFVESGRPEAAQVLSLLEMPTENLVELVRGLLAQGYEMQLQAVDDHGFEYLNGLKAAVKKQMIELVE